MRDLKLVGLSEDGRKLIFVDVSGAEFASPADDRLRAALRSDRARLGQLEIEMDSALRPRDIQARIRAGESAEAVAALAQVSIERIMGYAVPVLAERQHIAETAQRCPVRRKNAEGPLRRLTDVVGERLRSRNVDAGSMTWDAWRRDDGKWAVQATYQSGERERKALFVFDAMGRYSLAEDDEAKWLTGEKQSTRKGPQPREGGTKTGPAGDRRLSAVPNGEDLLSLDDEEYTDDLTAVVRAVEEAPMPVAADSADADIAADADHEEVVEPAATGSDEESGEQTQSAADDKVEPTPARKRKDRRRASVPSWDEIMFGKGDEPK